NAYVPPPQNRGFDDHYDVHDVFVLQIEGTKRWLVHRPVHPDPLRDQPWTDRRSAVAEAAASEPYLDVVLAPGDVLYLPRGWLHAAQAQGAVSVHLTLGIHTWTRYALAEQLAQAALATLREDPAMRATLPLGVDGPGADLDLVRESLTAALAQADPAPLFHRARRAQGRPAPLGPLAQLAAVDTLGPDTLVRLRGALAPRLEGARLTTRAGWLDFPDAELPAVARLLDGAPHRAADLGVALVARLLRAGVLVPSDEPAADGD
ncbi:JmjC domain-containing protein, partial [Streptomyces sp. M10]|uniref:JmjC domain-containing protein n=1 Tax=Streptomyces sp. M10 TaxID=412968 RepID=UPI001EF9EE45